MDANVLLRGQEQLMLPPEMKWVRLWLATGHSASSVLLQGSLAASWSARFLSQGRGHFPARETEALSVNPAAPGKTRHRQPAALALHRVPTTRQEESA